jgi:hypothetical protein
MASAPHSDPPEPGSITICLDCASVNIFNDDLTVRIPTAEDLVRIEENHDDIQVALDVVRKINRLRQRRKLFLAATSDKHLNN